MLTDLTALEQDVVEAARRGIWAESAGGLSVEELAVTEEQGLWVRAELIRELLLGRHGEVDPHGVRVREVRVVGLLDLEHVTTTIPLHLHACAISEEITCREARLRELNLFESILAGLYADRVRMDGSLTLDGATLRGNGKGGALRLLGAHIGGQASFDKAELVNDSGPSLHADDLRIDRGLYLRGATVHGSGEGGALRLLGAHIGGQASFDKAELVNDSGPSLVADGLRVGGALFLRGATMRGSGEDGALRLLGAHIGGQAGFDKAELVNDSGPSLHADYLRVDGGLLLRGATVRGSGKGGALRLISAHISGSVDFGKAELVNDSGPSLIADGLRVGGGLFLRGATVCGSGEEGALRLLSAHIGDSADFDKAELVNDSGPSLHADGLRVGGGLFLRGATVRGSGEGGALRLLGAHIDGQASLNKAELVNDAGPGLRADRLRVDGSLFLRGATVRGSGEGGALRLVGAHIAGQLSMEQTQVDSTLGPLLVLTEMHVAEALVIPVSAVCSHGGVRAGGQPCAAGAQQVRVQRLEFARLQEMSWRQWLHLLVHHTPDYAPQPFQQLAAVERAAGHDGNAREILITQQNELLRRTPEALGGRWGQWRHQLWGWLGRYGYRAHRLVVALVVILTLAGGMAYLAGQVPTRPDHHAAERVRPATAPLDAGGTACSTVELVGLGLDRGLPVGATGLRARCDLDTGTKRGQAFTILLWLLQAALWALATLTVAAYTGMIRKPA